ncbi:unnamed protein product, partial [Prorocentrum cordatum]
MEASPDWAINVSAVVGGGQKDKKRKLAEQAKSKGRNFLKSLVTVLTNLSLFNAAELQDLCGVVFVTFLVAAEQVAVAAAKQAGVLYNQEIQKRKEAGTETETLGPPLVHDWTALIKAVGTDPQADIGVKQTMEKYWGEVVLKVQVIELADQVRHCRIRTTRKQEAKGEKLRLTFGVDHRYGELESALIAYFSK